MFCICSLFLKNRKLSRIFLENFKKFFLTIFVPLSIIENICFYPTLNNFILFRQMAYQLIWVANTQHQQRWKRWWCTTPSKHLENVIDKGATMLKIHKCWTPMNKSMSEIKNCCRYYSYLRPIKTIINEILKSTDRWIRVALVSKYHQKKSPLEIDLYMVIIILVICPRAGP